MPSTRARLALSAAACAAALTLGACSNGSASDADAMDHGAMTPTAAAPGTASGQSARADTGDVTFAQQMIPHHEQALEMAELALGKASASTAVIDLARQVKAAQDPEIRTMAGWLDAWGAPAAEEVDHSEHEMAGMMTDADLDALRRAEGREFDRTWLEMMVAHHEGAVTMSRDVLATTSRPEVRDLAESIVSAQEREIASMRGLLS